MNTLKPIKIQKFESIDIMRGIAILMVMLVHTSQQVDGVTFLRNFAMYGQMGVQMFFVASAFTLCYSLELRQSKDEPLLNFYIRRFFRIAPGYYVGIFIFFIINFLCNSMNINSAWKGSYNTINVLTNILFLNGLYPPANNNIVPGGWSIGTEMLFYLIFPLIYKFYQRVQGRLKYINSIIPLLFLVISIIIQYAFYKVTHKPVYFENNGFIYFSILNQLPVFCVGVSMHFAYKNGLFKNLSSQTSFISFLFFSYLSAYLMMRGQQLFIFIYSVTPIISALSFMFLFTLLQNSEKNYFIRISRVGVLSYSCYLLHVIFAYFVTSFISEKMKFLNSDIKLIFLYGITVMLTYLSASFMNKHVELKGINLGKKIISLLNHKINEDISIKPKKNEHVM